MTTYDSWLEAPYLAAEVPNDAEDAYLEYLDSHRAASDASFDAGGHDFTNPDDFYAAGDPPESYDDFMANWLDAQEEAARYRRAEARYPDARI